MLVQRVKINAKYGKKCNQSWFEAWRNNLLQSAGKSVILLLGNEKSVIDLVAKRKKKCHIVARQRKKCNRSWCQAR